MWVEKTSKGHYKFVERYKSSLTGRYKRVTVTYGKNTAQVRKTATRELGEKITNALTREKATDTDIRLKDLNAKFLAVYQQKVSLKTYQTNSNLLLKAERDIGGDAIARNITTTFLNDYLEKRLYNPQKPLTNGTVRSIKKAIGLSYQWGVQHGYLATNPVKNVNIAWRNEKQAKKDRIENKYLTHEEYRSIINYCTDHHCHVYRDVIEFQYLTGLRFGELSALQVKDLFRRNGHYFIDVNGTMEYRHKPAAHFKSHSTKTLSSTRQVILSKKAADIARRNAKDKEPKDWLFTRKIVRSGKVVPIYVDTMNGFLKVAAQGINKHVTTHIFRHTHISNLADMGIPLRIIQKRVGHEDGEITRRIYLHVTKQAEDKFDNEIDLIDQTI